MRVVHQCYNDFLKINLRTCVSIIMSCTWVEESEHLYRFKNKWFLLHILYKQCNANT